MTPPPSPHSGRPSPPLDGPGRVTGGPDRTVPADRDARGVFADRDVRRGPAPVRPPAGHTHGPGSVHGPLLSDMSCSAEVMKRLTPSMCQEP
ncbi:hypothetical protein, partial [Catellatospora sp. NPDC049609]|uniref:hypothetical protein n=1 Tax=Catellatospora sp. NPDC049609 TaxID=3155505 RepID=UPI003426FDF5